MAQKIPLIILTGPTAVGKTDIAVEVALRLGTEIISVDSMQVYREMELATAKPSPEQRATVVHHLVDFVDPAQPFTVADYKALAEPLIQSLWNQGKLPFLVGGTRLYIKSLTAGFFEGPPADKKYRDELHTLLEDKGSLFLHEKLQEMDPETAARLHPNDAKRIIRALEVYHLTGQAISQFQRDSQKVESSYDPLLIALIRDREELYTRIDQRADEMIENGLVEEVRGFMDRGFNESMISMQGHGYKEILGALTGKYDLAEGIRLLKRNTRWYAKRQLSWLRQEKDAAFVNADQSLETAAEEILRIIVKYCETRNISVDTLKGSFEENP